MSRIKPHNVHKLSISEQNTVYYQRLPNWLVRAVLVANNGALALAPATLGQVYHSEGNNNLLLTPNLTAEAPKGRGTPPSLDELVNNAGWYHFAVPPLSAKNYALALVHTLPERREWLRTQTDAAFAPWVKCTPQRQLAVALLALDQKESQVILRILWRFMHLPQGTNQKYRLADMLRVVLGHFDNRNPHTHLLNLFLIRFA